MLISIYVHCDLDLWHLTSKINRVHPLIMVNMSTKFDEETSNSLVSIVFTRSIHRRVDRRMDWRTEPQQHYYIPTATRSTGIKTHHTTQFISRYKKNQGLFVKHYMYAPGSNKVQKTIFSFKVKVKVRRSLTLLSFKRASLVEYACQIWSLYLLRFKSYSEG